MTEREWLNCADPQPMLEFLRGTTSDRKLRLFAAACCRLLFRKVRVGPLYELEVEVAERYADGEASSAELWEARRYSNSTAEHACMNTTETEDAVLMADCAALNAAWAATQPGAIVPDDDGVSQARLAAEQAVQSDLLRDIFANPFRHASVNPAWLTPTVSGLASAAYGERSLPSGQLDQTRLAVLADALQDAGCDNQDILEHLRGTGPHWRGCWPLDLLLAQG